MAKKPKKPRLRRVPWWIPLIAGLAVLAVAGLAGVFLLRRPAEVRISETAMPVEAARPPAGGDSPEQAIEGFLSSFASRRYAEAQEKWMTIEFVGLFALMGGLEQKAGEIEERLGSLVSWEVLDLYAVDEGLVSGEWQAWVQHTWEYGEVECSIYRLAPPEVTGDHWRVAGYYRASASCEE